MKKYSAKAVFQIAEPVRKLRNLRKFKLSAFSVTTTSHVWILDLDGSAFSNRKLAKIALFSKTPTIIKVFRTQPNIYDGAFLCRKKKSIVHVRLGSKCTSVKVDRNTKNL